MSIRRIPGTLASKRNAVTRKVLYAILCVAWLPATALAEHSQESFFVDPNEIGASGSPHTATERAGKLETKERLTLRLVTDLGSIRIIPLKPGASPIVSYRVHIETDARDSLAQHLLGAYSLTARSTASGVTINGTLPPQIAHGNPSGAQFWVQFEVTVPANYNVDVKTEVGDIETQDIGGTANLVTQGGNIKTGSIGLSGVHNVSFAHHAARLETDGGHIQTLDVMGGLTAVTAGGHINVRNIAGDAMLRSGGGHIRVGQISGRTDLETDGGNITVGRAANLVSVRTGGGQIDFGEVRGSVRAQTGGGGIRVMYVSGPMEVESSGGSICLTRVAGTVRAATGAGTITAWINPDTSSQQQPIQLPGASQLSSGNGDVIVFLPRNLAATIEAVVDQGDEHRIEADSALHLAFEKIQSEPGVHAIAELNGGGAPLKLRTTAGKIRLQFLDSETALHQSMIRQQEERLHMEMPVAFPAPSETQPSKELQQPEETNSDWLETWLNKLEIALTGGLREDPDDFLKRLTYSPSPAYPVIAQRAGVQGVVKLQVRLTKDGQVEVQKLLEGEPSLADAAIARVKQWRGKPGWMNGKKIEVISVVTFNFQLR